MWHPSSKRKPGRPRKRWAEEIKKFHGNNWHNIATDREKWSSMEEAFIQQWRTTARLTMMTMNHKCILKANKHDHDISGKFLVTIPTRNIYEELQTILEDTL